METLSQLNDCLLVILGLGVFGGMVGAWFFQKIRFPQVVGYIIMGVLAGEAGFGIISPEHIQTLELFNYFALGIIGFLVGGELKLELFKKYGRQFTAILLGEGVLSFVLVGGMCSLVIYMIRPDINIAVAGGVVFGAIASATDPASTVDVLWEYRSQGVMTSAIIAVVALDDALAMTLYGIGTSLAQILTGGRSSVAHELLNVARELPGAIILGGLAGVLQVSFMRWVKHPERLVSLAVGMIMIIIGICVSIKMDVILAGMTMGFVLANLAPHRSEEIFKLLRSFSIPIYVLFFVLVGARLGLGKMTWWIWLIVLVYVLGRSVGKMVGTYLGARYSGGGVKLQRYLGMSLFAQGGVAVGLSIVAAQHLSNIIVVDGISLGDVIIYAVTATTLVVQLLGPAMVKLAIKLAGESGRNLTEEDVMATMKVGDVLSEGPRPLEENESLESVVSMFRDNDMLIYPVVSKGRLKGILSFEALKSVLADRDTWQWLLVADVMSESGGVRATPDEALPDVYEEMQRRKLDQMVVVDAADRELPLGILDLRTIKHKVQAELIRKRSAA